MKSELLMSWCPKRVKIMNDVRYRTLKHVKKRIESLTTQLLWWRLQPWFSYALCAYHKQSFEY